MPKLKLIKCLLLLIILYSVQFGLMYKQIQALDVHGVDMMQQAIVNLSHL